VLTICFVERVVPAADAKRSLNADEKILPRLPHDAIRMVSLDDQQLLALHPRVDCHERVSCPALNGARRPHTARPKDARRNAAFLLRHDRASAFLGERQLEILRREPNLASELEQLLLGKILLAIARAALELGGSGQHALEARAIESRNGGGRLGRRVGRRR
jgi:hypothetical protein